MLSLPQVRLSGSLLLAGAIVAIAIMTCLQAADWSYYAAQMFVRPLENVMRSIW